MILTGSRVTRQVTRFPPFLMFTTILLSDRHKTVQVAYSTTRYGARTAT
jgi:hypothetical protein